jgi:CRP-like cAMP-binding protein
MAPSERNHILERLAPETFAQISSNLRHVELDQGKTLSEPMQRPHSVYFPLGGVVSFVVELSDGDMIETGMVGCDGVIGAQEAINGTLSFNRITVQVPGTALVLSADQFRELHSRHEPLRQAVSQYRDIFVAQAQQTAACNAAHTVDARLCRWLLRVRDLMGDEFSLTQEFIAQMLAVQRPSVSTAAHALQEAELIEYRRGRIKIIDLNGLQNRACECYANFKQYEDAIVRRGARGANGAPAGLSA